MSLERVDPEYVRWLWQTALTTKRATLFELKTSVPIFDAGREFAQNKFLDDAIGYVGAKVHSKST